MKNNKEIKSGHIDELSCGCGHCQTEKKQYMKTNYNFLLSNIEQIIRILISTIFLALGFIVPKNINIYFYICSAICVSYDLFFNLLKDVIKLKFFNEKLLMIIASVTSFILREYFEGAFILVLFYIGEFLENVATENSRLKIAGLSKLKSTIVHLINSEGIIDCAPEKVEVGSLIEVKSGEVVPIDGILLGAPCDFDMKTITGESSFVTVENGKEVYSGAINVGNPVVIKTTKSYKDSTVENIISMVEGALSKKAKSQRFITSFAKFYTPVIFALSLIIALLPPLMDNMNFNKWIYKSLSFLVISCPCALVISIPLSFFVGIGGLAKKGILVKGSSFIESLTKANTVVFDKTGTLTYGNFVIDSVVTLDGFSEQDILSYAKSLELKSNHPISKAFSNSCIKSFECKNFEEIPGKGLIGDVLGKKVYFGNNKLMKELNVTVFDEYAGSVLYLSINGKLVGKIFIKDQVKNNASLAINKLKNLGVKKTYLLSGDTKLVAESVANAVGVDNVYSELMPNDKAEKIKDIKSKSSKTLIYVGDGINDAPSLALSDVGVAMGGLGSDIAKSSADVVIMDDNVEKIATLIKHSKKIKRTVLQNIVFSLFVKLAVMFLSIIITLPVYFAMLADVGVMLIAVCNSLIVSRVK